MNNNSLEVNPHLHKGLTMIKYKFRIHISKLSNQNAVFIGYSSGMNTKIVLKSFMMMKPGKWYILDQINWN